MSQRICLYNSCSFCLVWPRSPLLLSVLWSTVASTSLKYDSTSWSISWHMHRQIIRHKNIHSKPHSMKSHMQIHTQTYSHNSDRDTWDVLSYCFKFSENKLQTANVWTETETDRCCPAINAHPLCPSLYSLTTKIIEYLDCYTQVKCRYRPFPIHLE